MACYAVQYRVRNDGDTQRDVTATECLTVEVAVDYLMSQALPEWGYGQESEACMAVMRQRLVALWREGGRVWVPEWERKGNGDLYFVANSLSFSLLFDTDPEAKRNRALNLTDLLVESRNERDTVE